MLIYLIHPVSPVEGESFDDNLSSAERYLVALQRALPEHEVAAPWIQEIRLGVGRDHVPEERERGLRRCERWAARADALAVCGPRISSGMVREILAYGTRPVAGSDLWHASLQRLQDPDAISHPPACLLTPRARLHAADLPAFVAELRAIEALRQFT